MILFRHEIFDRYFAPAVGCSFVCQAGNGAAECGADFVLLRARADSCALRGGELQG